MWVYKRKLSDQGAGKQSERSGSTLHFLQKQMGPAILDLSTALPPSHNQYRVFLCSVISSADLSTATTNRKLELWMWSVSVKLGTVASLFWGPIGLLKTEGKKERKGEKRNI